MHALQVLITRVGESTDGPRRLQGPGKGMTSAMMSVAFTPSAANKPPLAEIG